MKTNAVKCMIILIALVLMGLMPALGASSVEVVSPTDLFYVNDAAGVLSPETIRHIVETNDILYAASGAQIVVVTVDTVGGMTMENYATTLFNAWGIGSAEKNNGILLLLSIDDDDYWLQPGLGIKETLKPSDLSDMLWTYLEPDFAVKDYDRGVMTMFDALAERIFEIERVDQQQGAVAPAEQKPISFRPIEENQKDRQPRPDPALGTKHPAGAPE